MLMLSKGHIPEDVGHPYANFSALLITLRNLKTTTRKKKLGCTHTLRQKENRIKFLSSLAPQPQEMMVAANSAQSLFNPYTWTSLLECFKL